MFTKKPSDFHPSLQEAHIAAIGNLIAQAYSDTLDYHLPDRGDNRWTHGVRRYAWACENIRATAESGSMSFLSILKDVGNTFIFKIGEVPVKFKRTNPEDPAESVLRQSKSEAEQLNLLEFAGIADPCELRWRLIVEDDYEGEVMRMAFIGIDERKITRCYWEVSQAEIAAHITTVDDEVDIGVELAPAQVGLKNIMQEKVSKE